jgi:hypothetical protein
MIGCLSSIRKKVCTLLPLIDPPFFLSVKLIEKFASPSEKPANQALLLIGDLSKSKQVRFKLSKVLNQFIARCNASILGVRINPLIRLIISITSSDF